MRAVDEVKQRTDIVEVVSQYTTLTKAGHTFKGLCPFHSEKHASFFVYPEQQSWHCFGACSTGGDVFAFLMKKENFGFGEALRLLAQKAGVTLPSRSEPGGGQEKERLARLYLANQAAAQYFHQLLLNSPAGEKAKDYLARRGFLLETMANFKLGFSPGGWEALKQHLMERGYTGEELLEAGLIVPSAGGKTHDRFRQRLMFPIFDISGRITGFGGRVLDDSMPKYLNSPQTPIFDKGSILYGIDKARAAIKQQDMVVIVEGYMDVITAHQNGFTNTVAAMGTAITERQVFALKKLSRNIVLALDADAAGESAMLRGVGYENTLGAEVRVAILPGGRDPDDVIKEGAGTWQSLVAGALPVVDYTFNIITAKLDLTTARDKSLAVDRLLPVIAAINNTVRQAHYLQKLARLIKIKDDRLEAVLRGRKPSQARSRPEEAVARSVHSLFSRQDEEYYLALLLQHPGLKEMSEGPMPEYFENSENREIMVNWFEVDDLPSLKERLDKAIHERLDSLIKVEILPGQIERKYTECLLKLKTQYFRNLQLLYADILVQEREVGGIEAELDKLKEQGIEVSVQLGEIFTQKGRER